MHLQMLTQQRNCKSSSLIASNFVGIPTSCEAVQLHDCCLSVLVYRHLINALYAHCTSNLSVFFSRTFFVIFHNDWKHHCTGNSVWCIVYSTQCMRHGMCNSKSYVRNPIPAIYCPKAIPSLPSGLFSTASLNDLMISIAFKMEHICHFPMQLLLYILQSHVSGHPFLEAVSPFGIEDIISGSTTAMIGISCGSTQTNFSLFSTSVIT